MRSPYWRDRRRSRGPVRGCARALGEIGADAPVASFVGIGHRDARNRGVERRVAELGLLVRLTGLDIAKGFAIVLLGGGYHRYWW